MRPMSELMAVQWKESVAMCVGMCREHGDISGWGSQFPGEHVDVQGCAKVASAFIGHDILEIWPHLLCHQWQYSGEQALNLGQGVE